MRSPGLCRSALLVIVQPQFREHVLGEVLCPTGRRDHAIGHGFAQFGFSGSCLLRDREVFGQSVGAADRYGTADPDQFPGLGVEHFFVGEIEKLGTAFHLRLPGRSEFPGDYSKGPGLCPASWPAQPVKGWGAR